MYDHVSGQLKTQGHINGEGACPSDGVAHDNGPRALKAMSRMLVLFCLVTLALFTQSETARAELPEGCTELGLGLTEHTCFHARFGPFEERSADPGERADDATANIDPVHTHFRVRLPQPTSVIAYTPERSGEWAVFVDPDVPLRVLAPNGEERKVLLSHDVESCPHLPRLRVHALAQGQRYSFVLGPTTATEAVLVTERVDDFVTAQGRDGDGDGYGAGENAMVSPCVAREGYADNDTDCDDRDPKVHPDAPELCDGTDQNCNGLADDVGVSCSGGSGRCMSMGKLSCPVKGEPARCSAAPQEKSGTEICNGEDDDCDGMIDDGELCGEDPSRPRCVSSGAAFRCGCEHDSDCGGSDSGSICQLDGSSSRCISGCVEGRNGCPDGQRCSSSDPARPGVCAACCEVDEDCAAQSSGRPRCAPLEAAEELLMCGGRVVGAQWYYEAGSWHFAPVRSEARMCVECVADDDCAQREDGRVACLGRDGTCARCNGQDVSRCSAEKDGAACLRQGDCGCRTDADCSPDRQCVGERQRCEERRPEEAKPEAGERTRRKPDAMASEPLVTLDGELVEDAAVLDASTGDAGPEDASEEREDARSQERSGCSCHAAGSGKGSSGGWVGLAVCAGLILLRRRRRVVALSLLLVGCAGGAPEADAPRAREQTRSVADDSDAGAAATPARAEGVERAQQEPAAAGGCTPELGEAVLKHSCQHASIGPFIDVSAAATRELAPAEVSASHKTYRVMLPTEADAEFVTDGWLRYRPTRDGLHVMLVKPDLDVRLINAGSAVEVPRLHEQAVDACRETLAYAYVYELERGVTYWLGILKESDEAVLFIEHIGTFGKRAWASDCEP